MTSIIFHFEEIYFTYLPKSTIYSISLKNHNCFDVDKGDIIKIYNYPF
jgi:hypothetical protein